MFRKSIAQLFIWSTLLFNLVDLTLSIQFIYWGRAKENNVLIQYFMNQGLFSFIAFKSTVVGLGCYVLYKNLDNQLAVAGSYIIFSFYYSLCLCFYLFIV